MQSLYSAVHQLGDLQRELKALSLTQNLSSSHLATLTDTLTSVANNHALLNSSQSNAINEIINVLNQMIPVMNQIVSIILDLVPAFNTLIGEVNFLAEIESLIAQKLVKLWTDTYFDIYPAIVMILQALNSVFGTPPPATVATDVADNTLVDYAANTSAPGAADPVDSTPLEGGENITVGTKDLRLGGEFSFATSFFPQAATLDQTKLLETIGKMHALSTRLTTATQTITSSASDSIESIESTIKVPLAGSMVRLGQLTNNMSSIAQGLKLVDLIKPLSL